MVLYCESFKSSSYFRGEHQTNALTQQTGPANNCLYARLNLESTEVVEGWSEV